MPVRVLLNHGDGVYLLFILNNKPDIIQCFVSLMLLYMASVCVCGLEVSMCQVIHSSVAVNSTRFLQELSRHNYVTPTSYLQLLAIFSKLVGSKKHELDTARNRTKTGLDKVSHLLLTYLLTYLFIYFYRVTCSSERIVALLPCCFIRLSVCSCVCLSVCPSVCLSVWDGRAL